MDPLENKPAAPAAAKISEIVGNARDLNRPEEIDPRKPFVPTKPGPATSPVLHPAFQGERPEEIKPGDIITPKPAVTAAKVAALLIALCLMIGGGIGAAAQTVAITNDLGAAFNVGFFSWQSDGQNVLSGVTNIPSGTSNTITSAGPNNGIIILFTNSTFALLNYFANLPNTNGANLSYLATNGAAVIQNTVLWSPPGNRPGSVSGGSVTNGVPQSVPSPVLVYGGTNAPNGLYTAGVGSLYNLFDGTGTNFVAQYVKSTANGSTGWVINSAGSGGGGSGTNIAGALVTVTSPAPYTILSLVNAYSSNALVSTSSGVALNNAAGNPVNFTAATITGSNFNGSAAGLTNMGGNGINFTNLMHAEQNYPYTLNLRSKIKQAELGNGSCVIDWVGDSTAAGFGAVNLSYTNAKAYSAPAQLAAFLPNGSAASVVGGNQVQVPATNYDPRILSTGGFSAGTYNSEGQYLWQGTVNNTNAFRFAPGVPCDTLSIKFETGNANGSGWVLVDGNFFSAFTNYGVGGSISNTIFTFTGFTPGTHIFSIEETNTTGNGIFFQWVDAYTASNSIRIHNCGWDASTAVGWATLYDSPNPFDPLPAVASDGASAVIYNIEINDADNSTSLLSYSNAVSTAIQTWKSSTCDFILCVSTPNGSTSQAAYTAMLYQLQNIYGVAIVDFNSIFGYNWTLANNAGLMANSIHPNRNGYGAMDEGLLYWLDLTAPPGLPQTLTGNGAAITSLNASNLVGQIQPANFDAGSSNLTGHLIGLDAGGIRHSTDNGAALTNLNSSIFAAGANMTVTTTTNPVTGVITYTGAASGSGGGGNVYSNSATAFTAVTAGNVTTTNLSTPGGLVVPISYPQGTNDMGLYYNLSGQYGTVSSGYFGQIFTTYVTNSLQVTNVEMYAGAISNGVTGFLTCVMTNSLPTTTFTIPQMSPSSIIYSAAVNIPLATNKTIINFPIPALNVPGNEYLLWCLTTTVSNNLYAAYYSSGNGGGLHNLDGGRYPYWAASTTNNFSVRYAVTTNALVQAGWSAKVDGTQYGAPTFAAQVGYNNASSGLAALSAQAAIDRLNCTVNLSNTLCIVDGDSRSVLLYQYGLTNAVGYTSNSAALFNQMQSMCIGLSGSSAIYASNVWTTNYAIAQQAIQYGTNVIFILLTSINDRFNTDPSNEVFTVSNLLQSTKSLGCENIVVATQPADMPTAGTAIVNAGAANFVAQMNNFYRQNRQLVDRWVPIDETFPNNFDLNFQLNATHMNTLGWQMAGIETVHVITEPYEFPTKESYVTSYGNWISFDIPGTNSTDWVHAGEMGNVSGTNAILNFFGQMYEYCTNLATASGSNIVQGLPLNPYQSGRTNVTLSGATSLTVQMAYPFPSTNYFPILTTNGGQIAGTTISAQTPTSFTLTFPALTFTGNMFWNATLNTQ